GGVPLAGSGAFTAPLLESLAAAVASPGAVDAPALLVDLGPLRAVTLDLKGLRGAGEVPATSVGPVTVGPVPWSLAFDWAAAAGFVELSGEAVALALREGAVEARGAVAVDVAYAGTRYRLTAQPGSEPGEPVSVSALPELPLSGRLTTREHDAPLLTFDGTPGALAVEVAAELAELAAALPPDYRPSGGLQARALVDLLAGPRYAGTVTVRAPRARAGPVGAGAPDDSPGAAAPPEEIAASFAGVGARFEVDVTGAGLQLLHAPAADASGAGSFTLVADDVSLTRFLPPALDAAVDGALSYGDRKSVV